MRHRDKIILQKMIAEIDIGIEILEQASLQDFVR